MVTPVTSNQYVNGQVKRCFFFFTAVVIASLLFIEPAMASGLQTATTKADQFRTQLLPLIRNLAILGVMIAGALFAFGMLGKEWFFKLMVGLLIVGTAAQLVAWFI